jgi:hypothetical protein
MTSPATVALLARRVTARMTKTNRKVRMTSARNPPPAFAPIIDEVPKPSADQEAHGDRRIDVAAGDGPDGIDQR